MRIELLGTDAPVLPGVTVGLQRGASVADERPADGSELHWTIDVRVTPGPDFAGPFAHGRHGDRFLYLCWSRVAEGMFRRAKLMLGDVPADVVAAAEVAGLRATVRLIMPDGSPLCAAVRPPAIVWSPLAPEPGDGL